MRNDDKLKVRQTESKKNAFKELTIIRDTIFWIAVVEGQNENAIFARPFNEKEAFPQKLTSNKYNIKNNFHGYGGKSYKCINFKNNFYLIWIDQITKAVWFQIFKEASVFNVNVIGSCLCHGSSICLHTKYSLAVLHENALSLLSLANKKVIEIN